MANTYIAVNTSVKIDVDDIIMEIPTKDLLAELSRRQNGSAIADNTRRDWDRLTDYIATGQTADALATLRLLAPIDINTRIALNRRLM